MPEWKGTPYNDKSSWFDGQEANDYADASIEMSSTKESKKDKGNQGSDFSRKYADCTNGWLRIESAVHKGAPKIKFKAFLTDFGNTFAPNWSAEEVFGRNDPIGMFKGTKRNLSLAWDVPSGDLQEAAANKGRANSLAKLLYPAYLTTGVKGGALQSHQQTISKPPLVRIRFANLIKGPKGGLLGWIESCTISPNLDMGYFSKDKNLYPKTWKISIGFQVLHEHELGYQAEENGSWFAGDFFY